jgi:NADH-quinone oxidoreductase subunit F
LVVAEFPKLLTSRYDLAESWTLDVAERAGAYQMAKKALVGMVPSQIVEQVKAANLRGRGGAGFPAGVKWGFLPKNRSQPVILAVNGDEGEPGTFKDRTLMERDPHRLIEGCIIALYAIGAHTCYIYVRGELITSIQRLEEAISRAEQRGYLGKTPFGIAHEMAIYLHPGAGAYICGEESALLESLEGKRGEPRKKPPFPAQVGAFGFPTIVNNVETIASLPDIIALGGSDWSQLSRLPWDGGVRLYGVSGHVKKPGVYEAPVGLTLRELIYDLGGGMLYPDRPLKAVIPGGSSTPVLRADQRVDASTEEHPLYRWRGQSALDLPMGVDTFRALGTMLGTCCATVLDSSVNMVEVARNLMHFYAHESCGQCTPCREGSGWLLDMVTRLCRGQGRVEEVDRLVEVANAIMGNTICAFGEGMAMPMLGLVRHFRGEFVEAAHRGTTGSPLGLELGGGSSA